MLNNLEITFKGLKNIKVIIAALILLLITGIFFFCFSLITYDKIYFGTKFGNTSVGGFTKETFSELVMKNFQDKSVNFIYENKSYPISLKDINLNFNAQKTAQNAYNIGREGNYFIRISNIINIMIRGRNVKLEASFDKNILNAHLQNIAKSLNINTSDYTYEVLEDSIVIEPLIAENKLNLQKTTDEFTYKLENGLALDILIQTEKTSFNKSSIDEIINNKSFEPQNAQYIISNGKIDVSPEKLGIEIDKEQALKILAENKSEYIIPIKKIAPQITKQNLTSSLFTDNVSSYSTSFDYKNKERSQNIKIASAKLNDYIVMPNEVFSFNKAVGQRTYEQGYLDAKIFVGNTITQGIAGGICQVSSTLYNAVLLADLEVTERKNHTFAVTYVPLGQDATVSYGTIDFKFKNTTSYPIKIKTIYQNGKITINLIGTVKDKEKTFKIINKVISARDFAVKYFDDFNINLNSTKIKQNGQKGYVVEAYKQVFVGKNLVNTISISKSYYNPLEQIVLVGKKKPQDNIQNEQNNLPIPENNNSEAPQNEAQSNVDKTQNETQNNVENSQNNLQIDIESNSQSEAVQNESGITQQ